MPTRHPQGLACVHPHQSAARLRPAVLSWLPFREAGALEPGLGLQGRAPTNRAAGTGLGLPLTAQKLLKEKHT